MTDTTTDITATVDTYIATWNEGDPDARAALIERAWTADGHYVDPTQEAQGHAALGAMAPGVHEQFPGYRFRRTSAVDQHHDQVRFGWDLVGADGTLAVNGIDAGEVADDGRLRRITGFFGDLEASA